jgi:hypothetical protein
MAKTLKYAVILFLSLLLIVARNIDGSIFFYAYKFSFTRL